MKHSISGQALGEPIQDRGSTIGEVLDTRTVTTRRKRRGRKEATLQEGTDFYNNLIVTRTNSENILKELHPL